MSAEKLLLKIETRTPGEVATDFEVFAQAMAHHINRRHAFGRFGVMRTARGMNVMVPRPPAQFRGINPALHLKRSCLRFTFHRDRPILDQRFWSARKFHGISSVRQPNCFAIATVNLRMKSEIRSQPL